MLAGRFAGKKAILLRSNEDSVKVRPIRSINSWKDKKFGHGLVVGIQRYPRKVHQRMSAKKIAKRSCLKSFVKFVNLNHIMPTR